MEWRAKWMQLQDSFVSSVLVSWNAFRDTFHRSNLKILFTHIKLLITPDASYWIPTVQPQSFPLTRIWLKIQFLGTDIVTGFTIPIIAKDHNASKCVKLLFKQHSVTSQTAWIFITVFITVKILGKLKYSEMWHYVASQKCTDVWYKPATCIIKMKVEGAEKNGTTFHSRRHHLYCHYQEKLNSHDGKHYLTKYWGQKNIQSMHPFWIRSGILKIQLFLDVILCQWVCYSQHLKGP